MKKNTILIGFLSNSIRGSIPILTKEYIDFLQQDYNVIPFYMERTKGKEKLAKFNFNNLFYFLKQYFLWCLAVIRYHPDIVHYPVTSYWNMEKSLLFLTTAKFLGVKYSIGHLHGGAFIEFWNSTNRFRRMVAQKEFNTLDKFLVLSASWKDKIIKNIKLDENRIEVLHNVIENEFEQYFTKNDLVRPTKSDHIHVLGFNLMDSRKGVLDLIDAFNNLPPEMNVVLDIIGEEREPNIRRKIENLIINFKIKNVRLHDGVWGTEKIKWFENADILVLPSYVENFPVVIIEAACAGLPVIASRIGALPDIFENNYDILFIEPGDIKQMMKYLEKLIRNQEERKILAQNIRMTYENKLSRKIAMTNLRDIYQNMLYQNINR